MWAWGNDFYGQIGDGTRSNSAIPVQVKNLTGVTAIEASSDHSLAVASGGTVWAWGNNASGQLGNGTRTRTSIPVQVKNLTGVTAVAE